MSQFKKPLLAFVSAIALGCETPELQTAATTPSATPAAEPEEEVVMVAGVPGEPLPENPNPVTSTPRPFLATDPIKGRRSRAAGGYLGAVAGANFYARHQMVINTINQTLGFYMATNGDWPKSHEEFMGVIIQANNIELPELDENVEYIFVPEDGAKGLQVRLKPGATAEATPPTAEDLADAEAAAQSSGVPVTPIEVPGATAGPADPVSEEPSPNIRVRAGQVGELGNANVESALGEGEN